MTTIKNANWSDTIGALAGGICLIHCIATPFIFVSAVSLGHSHHAESPLWWNIIDIVFLVIGFIAVFRSVKQTTKKSIKYTLWSCWILLAFFILNEKFETVHLPHELIYIPAFGLIFFHLYNKKYCTCEKDCKTD